MALEKLVGVPLFKRTTRSLAPSEAGALLVNAGKEVLRATDLLLGNLRQTSAAPTVLRVAAGPLFGKKHILPRIQAYRDANPGVEIRLILSDEKIDLVLDDIDLIIQIGNLPDRRLVAAKVAKQQRIVCASPGYHAKRGGIENPAELAKHPCLVNTRLASAGVWHYWSGKARSQVHVAGPLASNSSDVLTQAAIDGMGVALLPSWAVHDHLRRGELVRLLPDWRIDSDQEARDISFTWVPQLSHSKQLRSFVRYFMECFGSPPYWNV